MHFRLWNMPCSYWDATKCRAMYLIKHPPPIPSPPPADFLTCCPLCKSGSLPVPCLETTRSLFRSHRLPLAITTDHTNFWQVLCYFNLKPYFHPTNKSRIFFFVAYWRKCPKTQNCTVAAIILRFWTFQIDSFFHFQHWVCSRHRMNFHDHNVSDTLGADNVLEFNFLFHTIFPSPICQLCRQIKGSFNCHFTTQRCATKYKL